MSSAPFWTAAEDAVLRLHYAEGGSAACREFLPRRNSHGINNRAQKLGIRVEKRKPRTDPPMVLVTRVTFFDDEPLIPDKRYRRTAHVCYGFLPGGRVPSVFDWRP